MSYLTKRRNNSMISMVMLASTHKLGLVVAAGLKDLDKGLMALT